MLNSCIMHRHTDPAPRIMVWGGIGYHSRTPLVRIDGTLNSQCYNSEVLEPVVLPYLQGLATNIFQQIELLPWPARYPDLSPIGNMWSMVAQRLTQITSPAATADQLWHFGEAAWSAVPQEHIQSFFESIPWSVAAVTLATDSGRNHSSQKSINLKMILGQDVTYKRNFVGLSLVFIGVAFTVASSIYEIEFNQKKNNGSIA
ncbi:transposable element Tcb1 transposase [Trichonephila clavipes]|nr:transposable element Tcb1 transposase [Trichonephila clavipes]